MHGKKKALIGFAYIGDNAPFETAAIKLGCSDCCCGMSFVE